MDIHCTASRFFQKIVEIIVRVHENSGIQCLSTKFVEIIMYSNNIFPITDLPRGLGRTFSVLFSLDLLLALLSSPIDQLKLSQNWQKRSDVRWKSYKFITFWRVRRNVAWFARACFVFERYYSKARKVELVSFLIRGQKEQDDSSKYTRNFRASENGAERSFYGIR